MTVRVLEGKKMVLGRHSKIWSQRNVLHSCVVLNSSSCYTTVIKYRSDTLPLWLFLVLCLQEWGSNNAMTSHWTSKP